jgi:hypothetical protein
MKAIIQHPPSKLAAKIFAAVSICGLLLVGFDASAQPYSIDWYKIAGGGGTSSNGQFTVSGTIGQHDAGGPLTGGNFSLTGGFWSLFSVVQIVGSPLLTIFTTTTNTAVISWPSPSTGFLLQQNGALGNTNWVNNSNTINVVNGQNQIIVSPRPGNNFFRLMHQ